MGPPVTPARVVAAEPAQLLTEGSVAVGLVIHLTVENLTGPTRLLAFAAVSLLAVVVLTWMIFWMRRQAHKLKGELQDSVDQAIAAGRDGRLAVIGVAFLAVAREGLEKAVSAIHEECGLAQLANHQLAAQ